MKVVSHYGVHLADDGVAYLEQARGGTNAKGLAAKSPFRVTPSPSERSCNHLITLNVQNPAQRHLSIISPLFSDQLLRVMAPVPQTRAKIFYLVDPDDSFRPVISTLSRMSSPIEKISFHATEINMEQALCELATTNVQPLVIRQCTVRYAEMLRRLHQLSAYHPRTILLSGENCLDWLDIPILQSRLINVDQELMALLPWESIGAMILRSYMKGHWRDGWLARMPRAGDMPRETRPRPEAHDELPRDISRGESQRREFKSTFQYCLKTNQKQQYVRDEIPATVAGFLNADGGMLLIGIDDNGAVIGIEHDMAIAGHSWDLLQQQIVDSLINALGADSARHCRISLVSVKEKHVIKIVVERSLQAVFAEIKGKGTRFFCRVGNTTRWFEGLDLVNYIRRRFPDQPRATN